MKYSTEKMDRYMTETFQEILNNGAMSKNARPHYESDGVEANSKYITDVFMKFDLAKGELPIMSLRPIYVRKAIEEIAVIYQDQKHDTESFEARGVKWWAQWAVDDRGHLGSAYGNTVRNYRLIDKLIEGFKKNPYNRRNIINLWQMDMVNKNKGLQPCAYETIWDVREIDGVMYLDLSLNQRSSDVAVAGSINTMQYVALQMMVAKSLGWEVGTFSWHVMNIHLYDRNYTQAKEMIERYESDSYAHCRDIEFFLDEDKGKDFYALDTSKFVFKGYKGISPQLTFDLAV